MEKSKLEQNMKWVAGFNICNMIDAALTIIVVSLGGAELNPIMRALINTHPLLFLFVKFFIATGVSYWWIRKERFNLFKISTIIFYSVCVWNLAMVVMSLKHNFK